jgi:hypothetical protein
MLSSNYEYHMELIEVELSKKIKTEEDKENLIFLIEETWQRRKQSIINHGLLRILKDLLSIWKNLSS